MADPYATGVLDPEEHDRMVADIDKIARDANIQPAWIWAKLDQHCSAPEVAWVRRFPFHKVEQRAGLCLVGKHPTLDVEARFAAITGALVRNFVRARLMTLNQVVTATDAGSPPDMSCLVVPNFFEGLAQQALPAWRLALLLDTLLQRQLRGQQTVLYVTDMVALGKEYGATLRRHLETHYQLLPVCQPEGAGA